MIDFDEVADSLEEEFARHSFSPFDFYGFLDYYFDLGGIKYNLNDMPKSELDKMYGLRISVSKGSFNELANFLDQQFAKPYHEHYGMIEHYCEFDLELCLCSIRSMSLVDYCFKYNGYIREGQRTRSIAVITFPIMMRSIIDYERIVGIPGVKFAYLEDKEL